MPYHLITYKSIESLPEIINSLILLATVFFEDTSCSLNHEGFTPIDIENLIVSHCSRTLRKHACSKLLIISPSKNGKLSDKKF